jgi:hypothetical protein
MRPPQQQQPPPRSYSGTLHVSGGTSRVSGGTLRVSGGTLRISGGYLRRLRLFYAYVCVFHVRTHTHSRHACAATSQNYVANKAPLMQVNRRWRRRHGHTHMCTKTTCTTIYSISSQQTWWYSTHHV